MKSQIYLLTATVLMVIAIFVYDPYCKPPVVEDVVKDEVADIELYDVEAFRDTGFFFVRADNFNGYAKYEVIQTTGDLEWLKATLTEHLREQGYEGDILFMVLNPTNREEVILWQ